EVCKILRKDQNEVPILMLTAKDQEENKVLGLEIGADDYLTKPFSPREWVARIKALLMRTNTTKTTLDIMEIGDMNININKDMVYFLDEVIEYTHKNNTLLG